MKNVLDVGDIVKVSIVAENGLEVSECGVSLVYADDEVEKESRQNNMELEDILVGDMSAFQLSTDTYYLCRCDFFKSMEVDRPTPNWFRDLLGNHIDYTEIQGWRKTGRPQKLES